MLTPLLDFDRCLYSGLNEKGALLELLKNKHRYDPEILKALLNAFKTKEVEKPLKIMSKDVQEGMVLAKDVMSRTGNLIVNSGHKITAPVKRILANFAHQSNLEEPIYVYRRAPST